MIASIFWILTNNGSGGQAFGVHRSAFGVRRSFTGGGRKESMHRIFLSRDSQESPNAER
jgi:hypothetical protein